MEKVTRIGGREVARAWPQKLWREALGETAREIRKNRGERISDVADRAGISPQYLSEIERGVKDPSSEILHAVSGALGVTTSKLTRQASYRVDCVITPACMVVAA